MRAQVPAAMGAAVEPEPHQHHQDIADQSSIEDMDAAQPRTQRDQQQRQRAQDDGQQPDLAGSQFSALPNGGLRPSVSPAR